MTRPYDNIRVVRERLQRMQVEAERGQSVLLQAITQMVDLARECETVAHHSTQIQERVADLGAQVAQLQALSAQVGRLQSQVATLINELERVKESPIPQTGGDDTA